MAPAKSLLLAIIFALVSCSADPADLDNGSPGESPNTTTAERQPDLTASCGTVEFASIPATVEEFPVADAAAREIVGDAGSNPGLADYFREFEWRVAERSESRIMFLGDRSAIDQLSPYFYMTLEKVEGSWQLVGQSGECEIAVSAEGFGPANVVLDPAVEPQPAATILAVLINEQACASGRPPTDRRVVPVVHESESAIEITVLVEPDEREVTCQGNPWHPIVIELEAPWEQRAVYDASSQPPAERFWPPIHDDFNDG